MSDLGKFHGTALIHGINRYYDEAIVIQIEKEIIVPVEEEGSE